MAFFSKPTKVNSSRGRPPDFASAIGQSVALALKTLLLGMCFLATFSFTFVGLGLLLVFLRDLFTGSELRNT